MAITIHKILEVNPDPNYSDGRRVVTFILDDGVSKKKATLGGLLNHNSAARDEILAKAVDLFDNGTPWDEDIINIESPKKEFLSNFPSLTVARNAVDNISNLSEAKVVMDKMVIAIFKLLNMRGGN